MGLGPRHDRQTGWRPTAVRRPPRGRCLGAPASFQGQEPRAPRGHGVGRVLKSAERVAVGASDAGIPVAGLNESAGITRLVEKPPDRLALGRGLPKLHRAGAPTIDRVVELPAPTRDERLAAVRAGDRVKRHRAPIWVRAICVSRATQRCPPRGASRSAPLPLAGHHPYLVRRDAKYKVGAAPCRGALPPMKRGQRWGPPHDAKGPASAQPGRRAVLGGLGAPP